MQVKSIAAHRFNDFRRSQGRDLDDTATQQWRDDFKREYYAFTCLEYCEPAGKLFCGTTNMSLDLLQT